MRKTNVVFRFGGHAWILREVDVPLLSDDAAALLRRVFPAADIDPKSPKLQGRAWVYKGDGGVIIVNADHAGASASIKCGSFNFMAPVADDVDDALEQLRRGMTTFGFKPEDMLGAAEGGGA